ncbi:13281_t:CDS:10 [Entrophospora sp. SA101]|nr:717_t:CDS:10 [Entrophospora sp. SA101]CAJ0762147.1 13281_t:CDS:10 [Entrophospora sp. SA101]CAJ0874144.1 7658_t:CDS:10 [Entrophospora sp. SA101]CAJ0874364.1 12840_t:CDS:10 [Entrophospora sp. SA101]
MRLIVEISNNTGTITRGPNINKLSSVFEDSSTQQELNIDKPRIALSLPSSPRLPVPIATKSLNKKIVSQERIKIGNNNKPSNIDETSIKFGEIKAKFQDNNDDHILFPSNNNTSIDKFKKTTTNNYNSNGNISIKKIKNSNNGDDDFNSKIVDSESTTINQNKRNTKTVVQPPIPKPIVRKSSQDSSSSTQTFSSSSDYSTTHKSTASVDFEEKKASIAIFFNDSQVSRNSEPEVLEHSKPLPLAPLKSTPDIITITKNQNRNSQNELSLPRISSDNSSVTLVEEDELTIDIKRRKKLWNVIKELVETEKAFFADMELLEEVYFIQAQEIPIFNPYDCKIIFNNLPEVIDFSADFLDLLLMQKREGGESRMEAVYGEYCKRHEASVQKLQEFDDDENVQGFLQKCKKQCEGRTRSWDIASLLIKPVQRVLKYPLLLQQILSLTKTSHPDFDQLKLAFDEIQKIAERINEIKRRKDIVEKIVGSKKRGDGDIKLATGIAKPTSDDLYDAFVEKFKNLEQQGFQLSKDVKDWVKAVKQQLEDQQRFALVIEEFYTFGITSNKYKEENKRIVEYVKTMNGLAPSCVKEMEETLKKNIYPEIEKFLKLFRAPAAVMKKRERKILDYGRAKSIRDRNDIPDKSLQQSADAFVSISDQLNEELPKFFELMTQYYDIIVRNLIEIQSRLYEQMGMDFQQYFYKFVDSNALDYVSNDRKLVFRDIDIISEYIEHYHGRLEMDDELKSFVILNYSDDNKSISKPGINNEMVEKEHIAPRRFSYSDSISAQAGDYLGVKNIRSDKHSSLESKSDALFDDEDPSRADFKTIKANQKERHKKYPTDSAVTTIRNKQNNSDDEDNDDTVRKNKSKQKGELNFEAGILLKIIHIHDSGEWWYAVKEDTEERGWVDPG